MATITKLELTQRLAEVNALYAQARERISALEMDLEIARKATHAPASDARPNPVEYEQYAHYVNACRAHARATRQRVVSYANLEQFRAAHGAHA